MHIYLTDPSLIGYLVDQFDARFPVDGGTLLARLDERPVFIPSDGKTAVHGTDADVVHLSKPEAEHVVADSITDLNRFLGLPR